MRNINARAAAPSPRQSGPVRMETKYRGSSSSAFTGSSLSAPPRPHQPRRQKIRYPLDGALLCTSLRAVARWRLRVVEILSSTSRCQERIKSRSALPLASTSPRRHPSSFAPIINANRLAPCASHTIRALPSAPTFRMGQQILTAPAIFSSVTVSASPATAPHRGRESSRYLMLIVGDCDQTPGRPSAHRSHAPEPSRHGKFRRKNRFAKRPASIPICSLTRPMLSSAAAPTCSR